jgi:hypothetical protein
MIYNKIVDGLVLRTEKSIQDKILLLSNYSPNISLKQEISVADTNINTATNSRRFDLVQYLPNKTRVYELKKGLITTNEISSTLKKNYIQLAEKHFSTPVELVFTSPIGIDKAASKMISSLPNIYFINLKDLAGIIYNDYVNSLIPEAKWLKDRVKEEFRSILP